MHNLMSSRLGAMPLVQMISLANVILFSCKYMISATCGKELWGTHLFMQPYSSQQALQKEFGQSMVMLLLFAPTWHYLHMISLANVIFVYCKYMISASCGKELWGTHLFMQRYSSQQALQKEFGQSMVMLLRFAPTRHYFQMSSCVCIHILLSGYCKQYLNKFAFTDWDCATSLAQRVAKHHVDFSATFTKFLGSNLDPLARHVLVSICCWQQHFQQHGVFAAFECKTSIAGRKTKKNVFWINWVPSASTGAKTGICTEKFEKMPGVVQFFLQSLFCIRRLQKQHVAGNAATSKKIKQEYFLHEGQNFNTWVEISVLKFVPSCKKFHCLNLLLATAFPARWCFCSFWMHNKLCSQSCTTPNVLSTFSSRIHVQLAHSNLKHDLPKKHLVFCKLFCKDCFAFESCENTILLEMLLPATNWDNHIAYKRGKNSTTWCRFRCCKLHPLQEPLLSQLFVGRSICSKTVRMQVSNAQLFLQKEMENANFLCSRFVYMSSFLLAIAHWAAAWW